MLTETSSSLPLVPQPKRSGMSKKEYTFHILHITKRKSGFRDKSSSVTTMKLQKDQYKRNHI